MSSAVMMERTGVTGPSVPVHGTSGAAAPTAAPAGTNWLMVPRCTVKVERCTGGLKLSCSSDDKVAASMVQNLCTMLTGGMHSCCVMWNGINVCTVNLTMGLCRCETTENGVCITCTSGDAQCCAMIQACCDTICCMLTAGCSCCVCVSNTPVCCGTSGCTASESKPKAGR